MPTAGWRWPQALTLAPGPVVVWEVRIILVLLFLANAFLKFVWAQPAVRLLRDPDGGGAERCPRTRWRCHRAAQAAEINITAARSFNRGLRSVYFALAALGWLLGAGRADRGGADHHRRPAAARVRLASRRTLIENLPR